MDAAQLSAQLSEWAHEFAVLTGHKVPAPDTLWPFLAARLADAGLASDPPDVVSVRMGDGYRKVRITGVQGGRLCYEHTDGSVGFGLLPRRDVHRQDLGKLTALLERLGE